MTPPANSKPLGAVHKQLALFFTLLETTKDTKKNHSFVLFVVKEGP